MKAGEERLERSPWVSLRALRAGFCPEWPVAAAPRAAPEPRVLGRRGGRAGPRAAGDLGAGSGRPPLPAAACLSRPPAGRAQRWRGRGALCGPRGLSHPVPDKAVSCLLGSSRRGLAGRRYVRQPRAAAGALRMASLGGPGMGPAVRMRTERYRYLL